MGAINDKNDITATDSGIDEDEEYHDPMVIESVPGATDDIVTTN